MADTLEFHDTFDVPPSDYFAQRKPARLLVARTTIAAPLARVFDFFSRAENLERLTPSSLSFRILTPPPIAMRVGASIDYRIRLHGLPMTWKTRIEAWEPNARFVDAQIAGPYRCWWHEHAFEAHGDATRMQDRVFYAVPLGALGRAVDALFVERQLRRIFRFRAETITRLFA